MKSRLKDAFYDEQIQRLGTLEKFPALPSGQKELRGALRRISETDRGFLERLITSVVDTNEKCPSPAELCRRAGEMRALDPKKSLGNTDCEVCHGTGWASFTRKVRVGDREPYDADFALPCECRT